MYRPAGGGRTGMMETVTRPELHEAFHFNSPINPGLKEMGSRASLFEGLY